MSQVGPKRQAARNARMQQMFITARLLGASHLDPFHYSRPTAIRLKRMSYYLSKLQEWSKQ